MAPILLEKECGPKCRSREHVKEILSIIAGGGSLTEFKAFSSLCHNWSKYSDPYGRTALHLAASCGKTDLLGWMLEEKKMDLSTKDMESGYTALHRALFYGQLACARLLTQFGSDLQIRDSEGLSPLDIVTMDRPPGVTFSALEPNEIFTWGENTNSTLGHPIHHKRTSPEAVDTLKKMGISIKQMVLCKYHSVFLSQCGQVFTCGHGQGGRLGHGDQHTVLVPRLLESLKELTCLQIAASSDHTVLRIEGGTVYTFGLNTHHQLGLTPYVEASLTPKQVNLKPLKGKLVSGVCVGRFHSVIWTPDSVFTVGLNAGQLGHPKGEQHQSLLRQVSYLHHTDLGISRVACSDAATVCLTTKGDVFVLHEYQCRKIASRWQDIEQVLVTGGTLDHNALLVFLREKGGEDMQVMMRNEAGQLFLWRSSSPCWKRCHFSVKRQLNVSDVALSTGNLIMCTSRGESFLGSLSSKKQTTSTMKESSNKEYAVKEYGDGFSRTRLLDLLLRDEVEDIQLRRLPVVHRAVRVAVDRKGRNFAVLQILPNACITEFPSVRSSEICAQFDRLLCESDMEDSIHDAVIQVGERTWPVHKYVIAMRSDYFRNLVMASPGSEGEVLLLKVDSASPDVMEQLLKFIYTDSCDFLQLGHVIKQGTCKEYENDHRNNPVSPKGKKTNDCKDIFTPVQGMSAFQVQQRQSTKGGKKERTNSESDSKGNAANSQSPIKLLQDAGRKFGVKGLSKRLDAVKTSNGVITSHGKKLANPKVKFDREKLSELYDMTIRSEDGEEIQCHKCVLVTRLEYFYSMLATGWVESQNNSTLSLPVPGNVLHILMDFLYSDEAVKLRDCADEDLLCNILIVSDQLLAWRLKEMCEVALANLITFRNASDLLEFSSMYNANQLKLSCQEFISLNLAAMFEGRFLDVLSADTIEELTAYYRNLIRSVSYRMITPSPERPSQAYLDKLVSEYESLAQDSSSALHHHQQAESVVAAKKSNRQQQKKRNKTRNKSVNEDGEKSPGIGAGAEVSQAPRLDRNLSVSSDVSGKSEEDIKDVIEEINRQAEEDEKRIQVAASRNKERMKWRPLNPVIPAGTDSPKAIIPILPEDIPAWQSKLKTLRWASASSAHSGTGTKSSDQSPELVSGDQSPTTTTSSPSILATSPTSLRDIMQEESLGTEKRKLGFSNRVSWKDIKKQQSRDLKKQQKSTTAEHEENPVPKPALNPWAPVGGAVESFRDLMNQEEKKDPVTQTPSPVEKGVTRQKPGPAPTHSYAVSNNIPNTTRAAGRWGPTSTTGPPEVLSTSPGADNPWQRRTSLASSPPAQSPVTTLNFSDILQDEKEKTENYERTTQKPLAHIQLEEQAMSELLQYYNASKQVDEYITVARVGKVIAAPLWRRDRLPSGP